MRCELLIAAGPGEWRAVWLEDGVAAELHVERGDICTAGSVHLGRVVRRLAGLEAVLVDIGEERPGFLPARQAPDEGALVCVEIRREAQRDKGARLAIAEAAPFSERITALTPPAQLHPAPGFAAALALRLPGEPDRVVTDEISLMPELRGTFPQGEIIRADSSEWPVDLDVAFDVALAPDLALPGGGRLHLDETAAAALIDVDTGTPEGGSAERAAQAVNLAAAMAIAHQLRLRQLGGGIVVDFAALDGRGRRERVRQAMAAALTGDPAKPRILGWSALGHLEIVRPRRIRPLAATMLEPRAVAKNADTLAFEALRRLQREARANAAATWRVTVSPAVAAALRGSAAQALRSLEGRLGRPVSVAVAHEPAGAPFDIAPLYDGIRA